MTYNFLDKINSPRDLKKLSAEELNIYGEELRSYIVETVERQGGHLASNLGTVEMSLALHYVFSTPEDKILWDVGHQSYAHKIITGRREGFEHLRENNGITGFPNPSESEHDSFAMGHSSTSLSVALGFSRAREIKGENYSIISVIGDGAFTGGMAFEALNDIGASNAKIIIILNDNEMSISKNVGALSKYFTRLRVSKGYSKFKLNIKKSVSMLPFFGDRIIRGLDKIKDGLKNVILPNKMFEQMGIKYFGPFDGHNIRNTISALNTIKNINGPVLLHLVTNKGKGFKDARLDPAKYHGVAPKSCEKSINFSAVMGETLTKLADNNDSITAVTAAMCDGTGLNEFALRYPQRYFDVGIAEQHAVTMCAAMAKQGLKPYFAVYSSFLQRAYDQIVHDICIQNLPVTLLIDRAGVIGSDGITHQGVFDLSYLSSIPNMSILCPKDGAELKKMLEWSADFNAPLSIRYPKCFSTNFTVCSDIKLGKWEILRESKKKTYLICAGSRMLEIAREIKDVSVINARFIKPLDTDMLDKLNQKDNLIITMEDNLIKGGFGESVLSYINSKDPKAKIINLGLSDKFIENLNINEVFAQNGLTKENIEKLISSK